MSWTAEQHSHVVGLLRKLLCPNREVLTWVNTEVVGMQGHAEFPALLAHILGHGGGEALVSGDDSATIIGIRQAAGVLLRQHIQGLCKQVRAEGDGGYTGHNYARVGAHVVEVPLLVALCSGNGQIRTAASCCISALLSLEGVIPSNPSSPWALSLVSRLEQLAEANTIGDEGSGVVSTLAGVARCLGIIFEDSALVAIHGAISSSGNTGSNNVMDGGDTSKFALRMYALLSHVLLVDPQGASQADVLEIRLHALQTVGGIAFVGALDDFYFDSDDDEDDDYLRVEGVSPNRSRNNAQDAEAKRAAKAVTQEALKNAECALTASVIGCLGTVVDSLTIELGRGNVGTATRLHAIKGLEVAVRAMMPLIVYWNDVGGHITQNVLPTLLRWLSDLGAAHARDSSISGPTSSFLATCVDFITEISQQIDDEDVAACLSQNITQVLHGLLCAMELDAIAIEDLSVGPDADQEDEEGDVLFIQNRRRNKGGAQTGDEEDGMIDDDGEFADNAFDDEDGQGNGGDDIAVSSSMSHPLRSAVAWCISNLSMIVAPALLRRATFEILTSVVEGQVAGWKNATDYNAFVSHLPNWSPLEAALSLLAEVLDHTTMDFGGDEDVESIMEATTASNTALELCFQLLDTNAPHPAGPVRQSAAALMRRIAIGMFGFNNLILMDDADALDWPQGQVMEFTAELTRRVNQVACTLTSLVNTDANKSVRLICISGVVSILHRHFVEEDEDEEEEEDDGGDDGGEEGEGLDVQLVHVTDDTIRTFLAVTASLPNLKLKCRVAWYKSLSMVIKYEAESGATGESSVFMSCIVAIFEHLQSAWGTVAQTTFETYESLAIGELVCNILDAISDIPGASCPTAIVSWLWNHVCEAILTSKVDSAGRFAPTSNCWGPLSLDAIIMAVELASCACDSLEGLDKAATASLFGGTTLMGHVAGLTEMLVNIVTNQQSVQSELEGELMANQDQAGELLRASFGLIADFITSADANTVSSVADTVLSMIFKIIQKECQRRANPAVTNYNGQAKSEATAAALANSLWCFLSLILKVTEGCTDRQSYKSQLRNNLQQMCPSVFSQPQELINLSNGMFYLLSSLHEESQEGCMAGHVDTAGRSVSTTTMFNCTFVIVKCAAAFESAWFSEGGVNNAILLAQTTIMMSDEDFDTAELLDVGIGMGDVLSGVAPYAQDQKQFVKLSLMLAGYLAEHMVRGRKLLNSKKGNKSMPANERQKLDILIQTCHGVWLPIVQTATLSMGGAAGVQTLFPKKQRKLGAALGEVFFGNNN